ncbi:D-2-hydroxyacid dehydrogenase [Kiloniella sp.]|uniref:D-2-hydroxyacid dehydrogenase n=1 Tax=Kiloniella sp. TaxID=1938587 RepID=UPI003B011486
MKNPVIILHTDNPEPSLKILKDQHPDLAIHTCDTYEKLPGLITETNAEVVYSVRFNGSTNFPRQALMDNEMLKWVSVGGSGTDHLAPWNSKTVTVTNSAGVAADMMAQYALGAMFHFSLGFPEFLAAQKRRNWISGEVESIEGKTVLIIGLGKTGEAVALRSKAMGLATIGVRAQPRETLNVDEVYGVGDLTELWSRADFIVVCVPLLDTTRGLVGVNAFEKVKPEAVIIDVSRGGVIDEASLLQALEAKSIRGAALDVFATEPLPKEHPLWGYENVIITPHCSSVYKNWDLKSVSLFSQNLKRYRSSEPLINIVNPERGY